MCEKSRGQTDEYPDHDFQRPMSHKVLELGVVANLPFQGGELLLKGREYGKHSAAIEDDDTRHDQRKSVQGALRPAGPEESEGACGDLCAMRAGHPSDPDHTPHCAGFFAGPVAQEADQYFQGLGRDPCEGGAGDDGFHGN